MVEKLLLVEDTPSLSMVYETVLTKAGYDVSCAFTAAEAHEKFNAAEHGIVLLDMMLPDGNGADILARIKVEAPDTRVIVITANGSINVAVDAMRAGAFDFLVKPFDENRLRAAANNARASRGKWQADDPLIATTNTAIPGFIGDSPRMKEIYQTLRLIGRSTATVFITGESGTGKEVCAQAIHDISNRRDAPFIPLNCGAIPAQLLESEVFGHLKGSFTGAISDKQGAAMAANGGTLFLDEVCELDLNLQTKLLRFIQSSTVQPVGATRPEKVDVRIVCATNRDPAAEVAAGRFREDLYYRLHVVPVHLPPLRDRNDDVNLIADQILSRFAHEEGKRFERLSDETRMLFRRLAWPGNVRQLLNVLRNVVVLHDGIEVNNDMLPTDISAQIAAPVKAVAGDNMAAVTSIDALVGKRLQDVERAFIEATIEACNGSIPRAARLLDISPSTLYRKRDTWDKQTVS